MRRRYDRQGMLALRREAFLDFFVDNNADSRNETVEQCEIVTIRGPLEQHDGWWADSYEAVLDRVTEACESPSPVIVLKIDSPGGQLEGCFDAARTIRSRCAAANKRLIAYVDGCACSGGYALACAASEIVVPGPSIRRRKMTSPDVSPSPGTGRLRPTGAAQRTREPLPCRLSSQPSARRWS